MKIQAFVLFGSVMFATAAAARSINDAQIAAIVVAANQVDIDAGQIAAAKATDGQVKQFGRQMVKDHTGVNASAVALVTKLKVTRSSTRHMWITKSRITNR